MSKQPVFYVLILTFAFATTTLLYMPIIEKSSYPGPPFYQFNGHLQTIIPNMRAGAEVNYERERILTPDDDFLDLDRINVGSKNLIVLTHGLEGDSNRSYMRNSAKWFSDRGWDVIAWNCRSCSGEMNKTRRLYSHGEIEDIGQVIRHALVKGNYRNVALLGNSMGGNITMKYLGVNGENIPPEVKVGVAISAPADLRSSTVRTERLDNYLYNQRFLKSLEGKMREKAKMFPDLIDAENLKKVRGWDDFMNYFYAPLHDCASVDDFYEYATARNFLAGTKVPLLLINALNDPLLSPECSPREIAEHHPLFYLETPKKGGHCGFDLPGKKHSWADERAYEFIRQAIEQT